MLKIPLVLWHVVSRIAAFRGCMVRWEIGDLACSNLLPFLFFFLKWCLQPRRVSQWCPCLCILRPETDAHVQSQGFSMELSAQKGSSATTGYSHLRRVTDLEMVGHTVFQVDQLDPWALQVLPTPPPHCPWRSLKWDGTQGGARDRVNSTVSSPQDFTPVL